jgi:uncharacterized protein YeaO (DUF488 family)
MSIRIVRLGDPRVPEEGVRLGTVRRPPRGVRKEDYARLDYFDLWLPDLAILRGFIRSEAMIADDPLKGHRLYLLAGAS